MLYERAHYYLYMFMTCNLNCNGHPRQVAVADFQKTLLMYQEGNATIRRNHYIKVVAATIICERHLLNIVPIISETSKERCSKLFIIEDIVGRWRHETAHTTCMSL
ncbi:hypothetical protein ABEB36_004185 [Hypothenemus hampei]|uniref:Uncharacterized protein n=1 Tax=Hypothenemus hampei TaxID=57062 RepID=A0ABD1F2I0_HYPHA